MKDRPILLPVKPLATIADRIRHALAETGMSQSQVEQEANLSAGHLSRLKKGEREPQIEVVARVADALQVRFEWLAVGRGPMFPESVFAQGSRYPSRDEAMRLVRTVMDAAITEVQSARLQSDEDPGPTFWQDQTKVAFVRRLHEHMHPTAKVEEDSRARQDTRNVIDITRPKPPQK